MKIAVITKVLKQKHIDLINFAKDLPLKHAVNRNRGY